MRMPAKPTTPVQRVSFERAANGGLISNTRHFDPPRKPGAPYQDSPDPLPGSHPDIEDAVAHLRKSFGGANPIKKKRTPAKPAPKMGAQASTIGNQMLGPGSYNGGDGY